MTSVGVERDKDGFQHILVLNGGSSSIKFSVYTCSPDGNEEPPPEIILEGQLSGIGGESAKLKIAGDTSSVKAATLDAAITLVLDAVAEYAPAPPALVGHRVVHPGEHLHAHQRITSKVLRDIEEAVPFAPLHDPEALQLIHAAMKRYPESKHYACFDTVFHKTMPDEATIYPLPPEYRDAGLRRYGFHGLSCESIVRQMRLRGVLAKRMVIAHLGSGCSVTALLDGRSVDTTMGFTPTGGVIMGTRSGDLDPGLVLYLLRQQEGGGDDALNAVETLLNHESGLVALTGLANDVKAVRLKANEGDADAALGLKVFTRSVTKAIGAFCWLLGGLDAIVFAGGIGEHDAQTRADILSGLNGLGVMLNHELSRAAGDGIQRINVNGSETEIFIIPAQEDFMIALHAQGMARSGK
jgi:acetate kinase